MIPSFLLESEPNRTTDKKASSNLSFVDKTVRNTVSFVSTSITNWQLTQQNSILHKIDARAKLIFMFGFVILTNIIHRIDIQLFIYVAFFMLFVISKSNILQTYKHIFIVGFIFGFLIVLPASFNIFSKGTTWFTLIEFSMPRQWWIYSIPKKISVTYEGAEIVLRLFLKVVNSLSATLILLKTTSFENIIKALSFFRVPGIFLLTLTMSYKFIYILTQTTEETYHALKMRWWNRGPVIAADEIVAGRIGYLFRKSWERYEMVYQAMIARGFCGNIKLGYFEKFKRTDYAFILIMALVWTALLIFNYHD